MPILSNSNIHYVKFLRGSIEAWEKLLLTPDKIDDDTLYFIYESVANPIEGQLYLGKKLISGSGGNASIVNLNDIGNVYIDDETLADKQIFVYNATSQNWENAPLSAIINTSISEFIGATVSSAGSPGIVPAPQAGDQGKFLRGDKTWATIDIPTFDPNEFTVNNQKIISLAGFEDAKIGSIPIKTSAGIEWSPQGSGTVKRSIVTMEDLQTAIENGTADENTIYMIRTSSDLDSSNKYDEYMVINSSLERLGTFGEVNLDNYVTNTAFEQSTQNLNSRLEAIENNYITKTQIGNLADLILTDGNTTLVQEVNTINNTLGDLSERLQWKELENE